jgi:hypothetical protein
MIPVPPLKCYYGEKKDDFEMMEEELRELALNRSKQSVIISSVCVTMKMMMISWV